MLYRCKKYLKSIYIFLYDISCAIIPTSKNIIIFESNLGKNYSGNPKYIYEELIASDLKNKMKCVWVVENLKTKVAGDCIVVKRLGFRHIYYMCRAKFWICDSRLPAFFKKNKNCVYIQTWHGTPVKKLGLDMSYVNMGGYTDIEKYKEVFKSNTKRWDILLSQNAYSTEIFKRAFNFNGKVLEFGYPRNDILVNNTAEQVSLLKQKLSLPLDKKIILYAPTWRDNLYWESGKYKFDLQLDFHDMQKKLSDDYILLLKPHYLIEDRIDISDFKNFAYLMGSKHDIQELCLVSDVLITDYSSVMFDFSILKRPMIFYIYDMDSYKENSREFYFDFLQEVPGHIVKTYDELIHVIEQSDFEQDDFLEKYQLFNQKYNSLDRGNASKSAVSFIENLCK